LKKTQAAAILDFKMTEPRKAAVSLLVTILLFAMFTMASFAGLFDLIEARFYNPSVTAGLSAELSHETGSIEVFITTIERWFSSSLDEPAVKRSFMVNQSNADIYERSQVFTRLHERLDGLQWVRFIDAGGNRIHYSTWQGDLIREDSMTAIYRMYTEAAFYTPLENLLPLPTENFRIVFDPSGNRIVFSLPFYDALDAYRGLAVFSLSVSAIQNRLIADRESRSAGQGKIWLISEPLGLLRGLPEDGMTGILEEVAGYWKQSGIAKKVAVSAIESGGNRTRLVLLSAKTLQGIYVGNLVNESVFVFPLSLKVLLLVLFFLSVFLVFFLIINVRQDPMAIVQSRLKNLQIGLIKEYYEQKTDIELSRWGMDLMQRREEIREDLRHGLTPKLSKKLSEDINAYIDKSWNDLLAVIGGRLERTVNEEEIRLSLNRLTDTLSSLVEGGTFTQGGKTGHSSDREADLEKSGLMIASDISPVMDELESIEEMVPFVDDAEEFPASSVDEPSPPVLDEGEEMAPFFSGETEEFHAEEPSKPVSSNKKDGKGDGKKDNKKEIAPFMEHIEKSQAEGQAKPDHDETDGMMPFIPAGTQSAVSASDENMVLFAEDAEELKAAEEAKPDQGETGGMIPLDSSILPAAKQSDVSSRDEIQEFEEAAAGAETEIIEDIGTIEDIEKIEDIETIGDDEVIEELEAVDTPVSATSLPTAPTNRLDKIAQTIEWSESVEDTDEPLGLEIELSSPFSSQAGSENSIFIEKNVFDDENGNPSNTLPLEDAGTSDISPLEDAGTSGVAPLLYKPFTQALSRPAVSHVMTNNEGRGLARKASLINTAQQALDSMEKQIIREQNGIAYIQVAALHPTAAEEEDLDPRIRGLVNSVLKQAD
jgi:hypothetical protein